MRGTVSHVLVTVAFATGAAAADFGSKGGPPPANVDEVA
jgi:hypothetical protein